MASELQRIARGLVECLDEIPQVVGELQRAAHRCRQQASQVAQLAPGHPEGSRAALQLDAAARACERAAELAAKAPPAARAWAQEMADSPTRAIRPDTTTDHRPTGEELVQKQGEHGSRSRNVRRAFYERADDAADIAAKAADTVDRILGPPPPAYAETRAHMAIEERPREGVDSGHAASAMVVVVILISELVRWLHRVWTDGRREGAGNRSPS